jgi:cysteinyl-tRNA synthetase
VRIDTAELARMYERAYLDDMRALRNDSVDVYPRASDYIGAIARALSMLGLRIAAGCWTVSMCPPGIGHQAASS